MFRKIITCTLLVLLLGTIVQPAMAAVSTGSPLLDKLAEVEIGLFGSVQPGALLQRIQRLENDLFGKPAASNEAILVRVDRLSSVVARGGSSLLMKMNASEWMIFQTQTSRTPLLERLKLFEEKVYGQANTDKGIAKRIDDLVALVWPGGALNTASVPIAAGTRVKVKLLTELSSANGREGDPVRYQVAADVKIDNKIVIPMGAEGIGAIKTVKKAGPFGQSGQIAIDLGNVPAIDGTIINLTYQQSSDKATQQELAAGASLGGMVLLGPLGLAAGYLVRGQAETVPAGTELNVEVKETTNVQGLSLVPLQ